MIPIGDDNQGGRTPLVTWTLIALNVLAFFLELSQGSERALQSFVTAWGVVPREYSLGRDLAPDIPLPFWSTLVTSMFLHGGWAHLGGNMLFLWVFGDNLERVMAHARYLLFYLLCGIAAGLAHIAFNANSTMPSVGASGAISGVMGAYLILFPRVRVFTLVPLGLFMTSLALPAWLMLIYWAFLQFFGGLTSIVGEQTGGVAFWAHLGGFLAGAVLIKILERPDRLADHTSHHWRPRRVGWH
jgi:membrane associated rhomboid family serine protease